MTHKEAVESTNSIGRAGARIEDYFPLPDLPVPARLQLNLAAFNWGIFIYMSL
jgi:hypothetical protein